MALNVLYIKEKEMCLAFVSKTNSNFEKQIVFLMIPNKKRLELFCRKKPTTIIKRNNTKVSW